MSDVASRLEEQFCEPARVAASLGAYFVNEGPNTFTGSRFELLADLQHPNVITARDIVAVSSLSVEVPAPVSIWLLSDEGSVRTNHLLEQVPTDIDIWDPAAVELLVKGGPLWDLWDELSCASWPAATQSNHMGPTTISKLIAAKRPRLVPVWDSVITKVLGTADGSWEAMRLALTDDALRARIESATQSAPSHVSLLRRIDAVIWYQNRNSG